MRKLLFLALALCIVASCSQDSDDSAEVLNTGTTFDSKSESSTEGSSDPGGGSSGGNQVDTINAGLLTAGEWSDLDNWSFWNTISSDSAYKDIVDFWSYNTSNRVSVNVQLNGENVVDAAVDLINGAGEILWQSKTDNKGNAELWPSQKYGVQTNISGLTVQIGDQTFEDIKVWSEQAVNTLELSTAVPSATNQKLDVAFMVDATGSMADELDYLKVELEDVIQRVKNDNGQIEVNLGTVFYRDEGDDYVTRQSGLSQDVGKTINFIRNQSADGGGDFPEAVHTALKESVYELQWSADASARILFVVLDAPPHTGEDVIAELHSTVAAASKKGIQIIPIVASGIDKQTEFLMRYTAIATNGTYVFITSDSGIGGPHLEASVGDFTVEFLNDLMVRLINERLDK